MTDNEKSSEQPQNSRLFNPNERLMQIGRGTQAKDYLPVAWRLVWFRSLCPDGVIETEMVHLDLDRETQEETSVWNSQTRQSEKVIKRAPGLAVFRAIVKDGRGGIATGTKSEKAASFPDYIEKAETGAIGRALAALGYGTQFAGDEFDEQHRLADAPVDRGTESAPANTNRPTQPTAPASQSTHRTTQPAPAAQSTPSDKPVPVSLDSLKTVADKRYPGGWTALKAAIAEKFKIMGDVTDELISKDYNNDAQQLIRESVKAPNLAGVKSA